MPVISHNDVPDYALEGAHTFGVATPARGASEVEAWYTILGPGAETPVHRHDSEEVVVVLSGRGEAVSDGGTDVFEAPCTLVLPPGKFHQLRNTGRDDMVAVAAMRLGSRIHDRAGVELVLPWRS